MKKILKIKRIVLLGLIFLSINSFAAVVSDNDGTVFVTKAEFDELKANFSQQISDYNSSISGKIDGAISAYLDGMAKNLSENVQTGFDLDGVSRQVKFCGKTYSGKYLNNEPYTKDTLFAFMAKTYSATYLAAAETYHYMGWEANKVNGSTNNFLVYRDADGICQDAYYNYSSTYTRNLIAYSNNYAQFGGAFYVATASCAFPTALDTETSADTFKAISYGFSNRNMSHGGYNNIVQSFMRLGDSTKRGTIPASEADASLLNGSVYNKDYTSLVGTTNHNMRIADNSANCNWSYITRTGSYAFQGTKQATTLHWPRGTTTGKIKCLSYPFGSYENMVQLTSFLDYYTVTERLNLMSGIMTDAWKNWRSKKLDGKAIRFKPDTVGYGLKFNYTEYNPDEIFYKNSAMQWEEKNKMGNGFLLFWSNNVDTGELKLSLKSDTANALLRFKNSAYQTSDDTSDTNLLSFTYKTSGSDTIETKKLTMAQNTVYEITLKYAKNDKLYIFPIPSNDTTVVQITQVGDAIFIKDN